MVFIYGGDQKNEVWIFKEISTLALNIKSKGEAAGPGYASKVIYSTRLLIKPAS